jgi:pyruvate/2-oxoglutarate dehydrogenase complex dihydrolipoamide dehydrogenase (E3) component
MADYDLVVIGSGAAEVTAATTSVHPGASRVAIVERDPLWGTCVNNGCIPSKFLLSIADDYYYKNHGHSSLRIDSRFNLYVALSEKNALIGQLKQKKTDRIITRFNIGIIEGSAEFLSPTALQIGNRKVTTEPSSLIF